MNTNGNSIPQESSLQRPWWPWGAIWWQLRRNIVNSKISSWRSVEAVPSVAYLRPSSGVLWSIQTVGKRPIKCAALKLYHIPGFLLAPGGLPRNSWTSCDVQLWTNGRPPERRLTYLLKNIAGLIKQLSTMIDGNVLCFDIQPAEPRSSIPQVTCPETSTHCLSTRE